MHKITKSSIAALQPAEKDIYIWEEALPGFGVRVKPSGRKSYILQYRNEFGRSRRMTLGRTDVITLDQARKIARDNLAKAANGIDPVEDAKSKKSSPTFKGTCQRFMTEHSKKRCKNSTIASYEWLLNKFIMPRLGQKKTIEITRSDIQAFHSSLSETKYNANRSLGLLRTIFNKAEDWEIISQGSNPTVRVRPFPEKQKERFLSPAEISQLLNAIDECQEDQTITWQAASVLRLLLFTGCRLGEICSLSWDQVEFQEKRLRLDDHKTDQDGAKYIPLNTPAATELLKIHALEEKGKFMFPGAGEHGHIINLRKPWLRILIRAELTDVRIHDLRHTFASAAANQGISLQAIGKLLGHASIQSTQRYAKLSNDFVQEQSEKTISYLNI
ncbi:MULTISPECIES: site-specific integrase [unclassified Pseudovibrio]|uniref:tyrosine-type recombinase/integrase n=1 Tax=unclassified Pseudovibrio TaxID=2627060 RepID=UPI0007AE82E3|nr:MULTISPECIES: site-specific integrase [unclassified Pseudovibrio]KZK94452.1 Tyrosine recombinase XerC [Pseudovibrio sp. W74]KZL07188.1 Tyrosine recombinase XerC [Pseudovibrio sp. Ad14]